MTFVPFRHRAAVLSSLVDVVDWDGALGRITQWVQARESRYVCFTNVHSVVSAAFDSKFHQVINQSDLSVPDGAPVAWMLRQLGAGNQPRLNGPDLMWRCLEMLNATSGKVYFYGGTPETLRLLRVRVEKAFPQVQVVGAYSPPFRPATAQEDDDDVQRINNSGAEIVFVSLGCPKQESWMASHRGRVQAVMCGVGAAFDFHAGLKERAPLWLQESGLEWAFRLLQEPRRLWRRYLFTNVAFIVMAAAQWMASRVTGARPASIPSVSAAARISDDYSAANEMPEGRLFRPSQLPS